MIGIDTNILLRFFEPGDDAAQTAAARQLVRDQAPVFINPIVLAEFAWTLRRTFKLHRAAIYDRLASIVEADEFKVAHPEAIGRAVKQYETGAADFSDYLIGELNAVFGCETTLTFDKTAAKNPAFRRLPV
jgi:predicted nucleic-acid-binding protein